MSKSLPLIFCKLSFSCYSKNCLFCPWLNAPVSKFCHSSGILLKQYLICCMKSCVDSEFQSVVSFLYWKHKTFQLDKICNKCPCTNKPPCWDLKLTKPGGAYSRTFVICQDFIAVLAWNKVKASCEGFFFSGPES